jgi:glycine/D-amino acid oxidase-like deaminating enzyme
MLSVAGSPLRHSVLSGDIYLVPRGSETVIGATVERAGFDLTVVPEAIERLRAAAVRSCPALGAAAVVRAWAGLRPATPDMLPILGADPAAPDLVYACGHSKNGILLAPATAAAIVAQVAGGGPLTSGLDLARFAIGRFGFLPGDGGLRTDLMDNP